MNKLLFKVVGGDPAKAVLKVEMVILMISCLALGILMVRHGYEISGKTLVLISTIGIETFALILVMRKQVNEFYPKPKFLHWNGEN